MRFQTRLMHMNDASLVSPTASVDRAVRWMRGLILAEVACLLAGSALIATGHGLSPELIAAHEAATPEWLEAADIWMSGTLLVIALVVTFAGYVGLWRLKRWGRSLTLWSSLLGLLFAPMLGPSVFAGWELAFYDASLMCLGAALALAYLSSAAACFAPVASLEHTVA